MKERTYIFEKKDLMIIASYFNFVLWKEGCVESVSGDLNEVRFRKGFLKKDKYKEC